MAAYVIDQGEVAHGGDFEVLEGPAPAGRTVVLAFPTMPAALDWYHGDGYGEARKLREGAATARMYVVAGVDESPVAAP